MRRGISPKWRADRIARRARNRQYADRSRLVVRGSCASLDVDGPVMTRWTILAHEHLLFGAATHSFAEERERMLLRMRPRVTRHAAERLRMLSRSFHRGRFERASTIMTFSSDFAGLDARHAAAREWLARHATPERPVMLCGVIGVSPSPFSPSSCRGEQNMRPTPSTTSAQLARGTAVEVRTHYLGTWARGFEITSIDGDRAQLRRRSDGVLLPVTIPVERLRRVTPRGAPEFGTRPS